MVSYGFPDSGEPGDAERNAGRTDGLRVGVQILQAAQGVLRRGEEMGLYTKCAALELFCLLLLPYILC